MGELHNWKLFIDDVRMPHARDYIIARNSYDAIWMLESYGHPIAIAFDHDLGGNDTAMTVVNWLWQVVVNEGFKLPDNFTFTVHSANPVGAYNIRNRMNDIVKFSREQL